MDDAGGRFVIEGNQLKVKDGTLLDFETASNHAVTVTATDAAGAAVEKVLSVDVVDVVENQTPTDVTLSTNTVAENSEPGTVVGDLTVVDADVSDTHSYELVDDAGGRFVIEGNQLKVKDGALLDLETASNHAVTVTATDAAGAAVEKVLSVDVVDVDENSLPVGTTQFIGLLKLSQDTWFAGETANTNLSIAVAKPTPEVQVVVWETDASGNNLEVAVELFDDGDLDKGDDVAGDGIYNNKLTVTPESLDDKFYTAVLNGVPENPAQTQSIKVDVVKHITDEELQETLEFNAEVEDDLEVAANAGQTKGQTIAQIKTALEANSDEVETVHASEDGLYWETKAGITVVLDTGIFDDELSKGGSSVSGTETGNVSISPTNQISGNTVNSNVALTIAPAAWKFEPLDETNEIANQLKQAGFMVVEERNDSSGDVNVTVEDFKELDKYGVVVISSHGFKVGDRVCLSTGQLLTDANQALYKADLADELLLVTTKDEILVTPEFIDKYTDKMPNSLVYVSACHSSANSSLANAFLKSGAAAFVGYSDWVKSDFANARGIKMFDALVEGKSVGDVPGINVDMETDETQAQFTLEGANTLSIFGGFNNGTFESGNFSSWVTKGDTRLIPALGPLTPPEGKEMAIISTGLGSVDDSQSSLSQNLLVSPNTKKLTLTYDVVSEEPMEYVGQSFDDKFEIVLKTKDGEEIIVAEESVNQSVWEAIEGINFSGGDDTAYHTGFKDVEFDLTPFQGQKVTLEMRTFDMGDSAFDTAAVVDNISIETTDTGNTPLTDATEFNGKYYEWVAYTVQPGDTLSNIALAAMGDGSEDYYNFIAEYNDLDNPDLIYAGDTIYVPQDASLEKGWLGDAVEWVGDQVEALQDSLNKQLQMVNEWKEKNDIDDTQHAFLTDLVKKMPQEESWISKKSLLRSLLQEHGYVTSGEEAWELISDINTQLVKDVTGLDEETMGKIWLIFFDPDSDKTFRDVDIIKMLGPISDEEIYAATMTKVLDNVVKIKVSEEDSKMLREYFLEMVGVEDPVYQDILVQYAKESGEFAEVVYDALAGTSQKATSLLEKYVVAFKALTWEDQSTATVDAIEALTTHTKGNPLKGLAQIKTFFDCIRAWMPYTPGYYEYLAGFSNFIDDKIAPVLENLLENKKNTLVVDLNEGKLRIDDNQGKLHSPYLPGGKAVWEYVVKVHYSKESPAELPTKEKDLEPLFNWVEENRLRLGLMTDRDPFNLKEDVNIKNVDKDHLKKWFFEHQTKIVAYLYGSNAKFLK